jgi:hypothetical protein
MRGFVNRFDTAALPCGFQKVGAGRYHRTAFNRPGLRSADRLLELSGVPHYSPTHMLWHERDAANPRHVWLRNTLHAIADADMRLSSE